MRLLSIDWDFFFPMIYPGSNPHWGLYDWGCGETGPLAHPALAAVAWQARAELFALNGLELPTTQGLELGFWDRFNIAPGAQLFVAESHSQASHPDVLAGVTEVWNFDAHHDAGYKGDLWDIAQRGYVTCEDWLAAYFFHRAKLLVRYPAWKKEHWKRLEPRTRIPGVQRRTDHGKRVLAEFHRVFICRSGSWVPPWCDEAFAQFVESCPVQGSGVLLDEIPERPQPRLDVGITAQLAAFHQVMMAGPDEPDEK